MPDVHSMINLGTDKGRAMADVMVRFRRRSSPSRRIISS